jgi:hypothetical protein
VKRFRKPLVVGVLVAAVLAVTVVVCDQMPPAEPPLRVGMTGDEVFDLLRIGISGSGTMHSWETDFISEPDWLGNRTWIEVEFDGENRVVWWNTEPMHRTRPPWLDRALKAVGW